MSDRPFTIGGSVVPSGSKLWVQVKVMAEPDETSIHIPVLVLRGATPGPTLNLSAGQHGDEYMAGEAIRRLYTAVDPAQLRGTVLASPCINVPAFKAGTRYTPDDRADLNRVWPGRPDGTLTERIASAYMDEVVTKSDFLLDFHDGGTWLNMEPLCGVDKVADAQLYQRARQLAALSGVPAIWEDDPWPATLPVEAMRLGIPSLTVENTANLDDMEAVVSQHLDLIYSTMRGLGMLDGEPGAGGASEPLRGKFGRCTVRGLFQPMARRGTQVAKGDLLGLVVGPTGAVMEEIHASGTGRLLFLRRISVVQPGERTYLIGEPVA
jgi:predicted deacylase